MALLFGQAFILLFNNDSFYDVNKRSVELYLTSSPAITLLCSLIYIIFTIVIVKDQYLYPNNFSYQEFQGGLANATGDNEKQIQNAQGYSGPRKRSASHDQKQNQQQLQQKGNNNNQQDQQDSQMNFDNQSLQLFDSASQAEDSERNTEGGNQDSKNSTGKKNSMVGQRQKKMDLNLEEIENISDLDLESVKNTSSRAITFNQFELTKNIMMNGNDDKVDLNQSNGDLDNSNKQDKINSSQIELITSISDNQMNSAGSTDRRIKNLNMTLENPRNNSLGQITDKNNRRSLFERTRQHSVQLNTSDAKKLSANPYEKLDEDQQNQTTSGPQEQNTSPSKQELNQNQQQQDINYFKMLQDSRVKDFKAIISQEFVKRWIAITVLIAIVHQSIDEKLQVQLQGQEFQNPILKKTSQSIVQSNLLPIILYLPTTILILRKIEKIKFIRLMIVMMSLTFVSEILLNQYQQHQNSPALIIILTGIQKSFSFCSLAVLYLLGLRLVKIEQRFSQISLTYLCQCFGSFIGSLLGQFIEIKVNKTLLSQNILGLIQIVLSIIALLFTLFINASNEELFRSSSSSDVLSGPQRLEQIQKQLENQEKAIIDPSINLQYVDSKKRKNKKQQQVKKQKKSRLREIHITNPQQPSEIIHKLEEEDEIERSSTANQNPQQIQQQQFQRRIL